MGSVQSITYGHSFSQVLQQDRMRGQLTSRSKDSLLQDLSCRPTSNFLMNRPCTLLSNLSCPLCPGSKNNTTTCFGYEDDIGDDQASTNDSPNSEDPAP